MALTVTYICNNSSTLYSGDFFVFQCMLPTWLKMCAWKYHVSGCFKHSTLCLVRSYSYWNILSLTCLSALMCNVFSFKESDSWKPLAYNYFYMVRRQTYEITHDDEMSIRQFSHCTKSFLVLPAEIYSAK